MRDKRLQRDHRPTAAEPHLSFHLYFTGRKSMHTDARWFISAQNYVTLSQGPRQGHKSQCCLFDPSLPLFRVKEVRQWLNRQSSGDQSDSSHKQATNVMKEVRGKKKINSTTNPAEDIWLWSADPWHQSMGADSPARCVIPQANWDPQPRKLHVRVLPLSISISIATSSTTQTCLVILLTP